MNSIDVGKFISELRKSNNLTQKELAEKLNVSDKAVSKWETGKCYPDIEMIEKLSIFFDVSINDVLSGRFVERENSIQEADNNIVQIMKKSKKSKMVFRIISLVLLLLIVASIVIAANEHKKRIDIAQEHKILEDKVEEHQILENTQVSFDSKTMLRIDIKEAGLKNVLIRQLTERTQFSKDQYGQAYLLADDRYERGFWLADHYLAIVLDDKITLKDLSNKGESIPKYTGNLFLNDVDGDGFNEIMLQELHSMNGGFGGYTSRVFDFKNDEIVEIFCSYKNYEVFDTGFYLANLKNNKITIKNKFTGYKKTISLEDRDDRYFNLLYEQYYQYPKEEPSLKLDIMTDTFYQFETVDIDDDGIYELKCRQYTSLLGHMDYIGSAISILKYDKTTKKFKVVKAWFVGE